MDTRGYETQLAEKEDRLAEQRGLARDLTTVLEKRNAALREIADMPFSMVNNADSLRHTIQTMQSIARKSLGR